jgi:hypothetical protein
MVPGVIRSPRADAASSAIRPIAVAGRAMAARATRIEEWPAATGREAHESSVGRYAARIGPQQVRFHISPAQQHRGYHADCKYQQSGDAHAVTFSHGDETTSLRS